MTIDHALTCKCPHDHFQLKIIFTQFSSIVLALPLKQEPKNIGLKINSNDNNMAHGKRSHLEAFELPFISMNSYSAKETTAPEGVGDNTLTVK